MPLKPGKKNIGTNIKELHKGKTYERTKREHGKAAADQQAIAIAEAEARKGKKKKK